MKDIGIFIQARTGSTRLPNKIIMPFFQDYNCLELIIDRIKNKINIPIYVVTSTNSNDDIIEKIALDKKVFIFRGDEENVLDRFLQCAKQNGIKKIIRICSDNPFLDISELQKLINEIDHHDYISFKINDKPSILTHFGFWSEYTTLDALEKVIKYTNDKLYLEHVTNFIYNNKDKFNLKWINFDTRRFSNLSFRLTLDTEVDFENLTNLYKTILNNNKEINIENVVSELRNDNDLIIKMNNEIIKNSK
jgi:spore coat polysaccharide biosynthesis protein SpsF (cytidylyltransferase family)